MLYSVSRALSIGNTDIVVIFENRASKYSGKTHMHSHIYFEVHFLIGGSSIISTENAEYIVKENSALIIPSNVMHSVVDSTDCEKLCVSFLLRKNDKVKSENTYDTLFSAFLAAKEPLLRDNSLKNIIIPLLEIIDKDDVYHMEKTKSLLALMFLELARSNEDKHTQTEVQKNEYEYYRSGIIERYITTNFANPNANIKEVSELLFLSVKQTSRIVKKLSGMTFGQMLLSQRMYVAKELLESDDLKIYEVAQKVGYNSYEVFYKAYTGFFGIPPGRACLREKSRK